MVCDVNGLSVYYETIGEGMPVLMIHGYTPDHRLMKGCMEPVFRELEGYRRIYLDLPGMGLTEGPAWVDCSDRMLEVVTGFIEKIIPEEVFLAAGESYGGYMVRGLVRSMPERLGGILLLCPMVVPDKSRRDLPPHAVIKKDEELLSGLSAEDARDLSDSLVVQSRRIYGRYREEVLSGVSIADNAFLAKIKNNGYPFSFDPDEIAPFDKPSLFLLGRQDSVVGYRDAWRIMENYPRATFAVLDSAGHNLQVEQERLFEELTRDWLYRAKG